MSRTRRMKPSPYLRKVNGIYQVQRKVPDGLAEAFARITGHKNRPDKNGVTPPVPRQDWFIKSTGTGNQGEAEAIRDEKLMPEFRRIRKQAEAMADPEFLAGRLVDTQAAMTRTGSLVDRTSALLGTKFGDYSVPDERLDQVREIIHAHYDRYDAHIDNRTDLIREIETVLRDPTPDWAERRASIIASAMKSAVQADGRVITLDVAIGDWKKKHGPWRDADAEKKAEQAKRRAAESLFASAGTGNMLAIDQDMIQSWKDGLTDPRQAHDYVCEVKTLYKRLEKENRLKGLPNGNPAANIELPPKPDHQKRNKFAPERAALILASAAKSENPLIKWGVPIMAYTGMIATEFVYAPTSEIRKERGVRVWHVGQNRMLKTNNRPRVIPLHPALIDAGFLDYVQSRGDGLMFDEDNTTASNTLMKHLRDLDIQGDDQVCYSWRHGFISQLVNDGTDPTLRRYLDGHGLKGIDEQHYIHHNMANMVKAIASVDPTKVVEDLEAA